MHEPSELTDTACSLLFLIWGVLVNAAVPIAYSKIINPSAVLLQRGLHCLAQLPNLPDPDLALLPSGDDPLAVACGGHCCYAVDVSVVDDVPGKGKEGCGDKDTFAFQTAGRNL